MFWSGEHQKAALLALGLAGLPPRIRGLIHLVMADFQGLKLSIWRMGAQSSTESSLPMVLRPRGCPYRGASSAG